MRLVRFGDKVWVDADRVVAITPNFDSSTRNPIPGSLLWLADSVERLGMSDLTPAQVAERLKPPPPVVRPPAPE